MNFAGRNLHSAKGHMAGGTHRSCGPEQTLEAYSRFMPELGITRLANVTGLDRIGIPVYVAIRPNARSLAAAQGKGIDKAHAKVSALMESVECWHAEWIEQPLRMESYCDLAAGESVVDVAALPLRVGGRHEPDLPIAWVQGYDVLRARATWVPYEYVTMNTLLTHNTKLTFFNSTNGLASGNHLLEAIVHGLLEVIERDALAQWGRQSAAYQQQCKVNVSSVEEIECRALLQHFSAARVDVAIWDVTSDLGVPAYECAIGEQSSDSALRRLGIFRGYGCHLAPGVALSRALSEAAQSRLTIISGSRDDNPMTAYTEQADVQRMYAVHRACFQTPGRLPFGQRPSLATASFEDDIEHLLGSLRVARIGTAIVVDLTSAKFGIPVVKVVVPGLETGLHGPIEKARVPWPTESGAGR